MGRKNQSEEKRRQEAEKIVEAWNRDHSIGTEVVFQAAEEPDGFITRTRTEAWVMGVVPMVMIEGRSGSHCLEFIKPLPEGDFSKEEFEIQELEKAVQYLNGYFETAKHGFEYWQTARRAIELRREYLEKYIEISKQNTKLNRKVQMYERALNHATSFLKRVTEAVSMSNLTRVEKCIKQAREFK